jgi:hypothetical protein
VVAMPVLPTISGVYRITLDWNTNVGITPRNVFHVRKNGSNEVEVSDIILGDAVDHLFAPMSASWDCPELAVLKLDGTSATQFFPIDSGTFLGGTTGSDVIPQACAVVSFHTLQRGPRGRGRMYVGPISENQQAQGALNTTTSGDMAVAWAEFISNLSGDDCSLVVASYVHSDAHDVTSFNIDALIGTQRRRLDQLR